MCTLTPNDLLVHLIKLEGDGNLDLEIDGICEYKIPSGEIWTYRGHRIESITQRLTSSTELTDLITTWFASEYGFITSFQPTDLIDTKDLQRFRLIPILFSNAKYPDRFVIPTNCEVSECEIWDWAEQQEIATINDVQYDEYSECVFIIPEWDDQKTNQIGQALTNDFYKYFSNSKP